MQRAKEATIRVTQIPDAHYEKAIIIETLTQNCSYLSSKKQKKLV